MCYILTIDSGNTFIKWGMHNQYDWICQDKVKHNEYTNLAKIWKNLPEPSLIIVSNVAGDTAQESITILCSIWKTRAHWIVPVRQQCGVRNFYSKPNQLGSDRWAALIAAWNYQSQACLVINIGTAMTVDALSDTGEFLGGIIVPGPNLMFKVLRTYTEIPLIEQGDFNHFPVNTADAVFSGVIQSLVGSIEQMSRILCMRLGYFKQNCIISGGATSLILPYLNGRTKVVDNLVLEGLLLIARNQSKPATSQ